MLPTALTRLPRAPRRQARRRSRRLPPHRLLPAAWSRRPAMRRPLLIAPRRSLPRACPHREAAVAIAVTGSRPRPHRFLATVAWQRQHRARPHRNLSLTDKRTGRPPKAAALFLVPRQLPEETPDRCEHLGRRVRCATCLFLHGAFH